MMNVICTFNHNLKETLLKCFALILKKVFKNRMKESVMKTEVSFIKE